METTTRLAPELIYFSSASGNTDRFVRKLGLPARRLPLRAGDPPIAAERPYVLIVPTYGGGSVTGAVPKQVIHFLNDPANRSLIRGVIAAGNTNFGTAYGLAGQIVATKCGVPHLYTFELLGTDQDVAAVRNGLEQWWSRRS
ncbi:MAG: class Ib ribonucleoside-diphosphate reductase assembly flavoprotein NrdI [Bifidobacteriaceae bacterium]|jgi:protein involved in ribonucleotide reduction|nr:class Ib ribonucleoside-diphosphate reductase assembly flavoprotein NrdI [Bifidobacteriaceae bacterium]